MFALNETGQVIWDALRTRTIAEVAALLVERFDVSPELAERDVRTLADQLVSAGLLRARDAGAS
jgi:DeoR/GlpR family transcriptional regulator of sugar metabolism